MTLCNRGFTSAILLLVSAGMPRTGAAQASDAYLDPVAAEVHAAARTAWQEVDASVARYTALIQQRIAADLRLPLKDRTLYRNETAVRAFWDRDHDALVQVLGANSRYPGRESAVREGDLNWLDDLAFDAPFEPGGDRLFFGARPEEDSESSVFEPSQEEFWVAHPLAPGADTLYRYRSGDTLTLSLPDGRTLRTVRLDVLPREADVHRISGALWIDPTSGALVQAVYRLSRRFDALRDIPELREEDEAGEFRRVPGILKPWTFDLRMVAIEYGLWDFQTWLPRTMRVEGEAAAGILKFPVRMDIAYRIESVTTAEEADAEARALRAALDSGRAPGLTERHFASRAEAMAFIAELLSDRDAVPYEPLPATEGARDSRATRLLVPEDRSRIAASPDLPPPIWEDAPGFADPAELEQMFRALADLPEPPSPGVLWAANWGWHRPDLLRYNRVEGPAVGARLQARTGGGLTGPLDLSLTGFLGLADLEPKARLQLERATLRRRAALGLYREVRAVEPGARHLEVGNSVNALLFGRDDGEYFRATGLDLTLRPPEASRAWWEVRLYGERHASLSKKTDFALFRDWGGEGIFRPNLTAARLDEAGGEFRLAPWWGTDPLLPQVGLELYGQGAAWRVPGDAGSDEFVRASAVARVVVPVADARWRVGVEAGGGTTFGDAPVQRNWFLGGPTTLRGYPASARFGPTFVRGRLEAARVLDVGTLSAFTDAAWAGDRDDFDAGDLLYGVGVGGSILDGLIRLDLSHGLRGPERQFRVDLYLDAIL
ncbi:MAG: hypothetical protein RQ751_00130 [Longimicrobiales bacterium]|nr:hypothetical protein [Longimicrobiales bacterium]